jgi:signal transduction histidine kinase
MLVRRVGARFGPLAIAIGMSFTIWLACNLSSSTGARAVAGPLSVAFRVFLGALVLAWPIGRLTRADRMGLGVYAATLSCATAVFLLAAPDFGDELMNPVNVVTLPTLVSVAQQFLVITLVPVWGIVLAVVVVRRGRLLPPAARALFGPGMVAALIAGGSDFVLFFSDRLLADVSTVVSVGRWIDVARFGAAPLVLALAVRRAPASRDRLRTIDIGVTRTVDLQQALVGGLGDPTVQLGFRRPDGSWVGPTGTRTTLGGVGRSVTAVKQGDVVVAAIDHAPALDDRPSVVEAALATVALSLEHARLDALALARLGELQRVRLGIVAAEDGARHRLERDLHDGAQQRLVGLALQARLAVTGGAAAVEVAELNVGVDEARSELRDIIDGALPAVLAEGGLVPALDMLATTAPMAVRVHVDVPAEVPTTVVGAAWFVVSEAVANAVKHARANELIVRVATGDGELCVEVSDDGVGGADIAKGEGLAGLHRRVAALGGTLAVTSSRGNGTTLRVALPLAGPN